MRRLLASAAIMLLVAGPLSNSSIAASSNSKESEIDRFIESQLDKHGVPGLALAVVQGGELRYAAGYGSAGGGRAMTPDTPMTIGSVTKSFTAVAVLQLVEKGLIDLDEPVRSYLPSFRVADPGASKAITIRHLLNHTSGLSELGYNRILNPATSLEEGVEDLARARLTAPVGREFQYFNGNYYTLGLVIETVTGQTFGDYVTENIFAPLGMTNSYAATLDAPREKLAQGHSKIFGFTIARRQPFRQYMFGAGYLISTARELSRFLIAMGNGGTYDGIRILSRESVEMMQTPPEGVEGSTYGMGWEHASYGGEAWEGHGGADETFMASLAWVPEHDGGYVWLINQEYLIDPARAQLDTGLTLVVARREPAASGVSMRVLGLIILAVFLIALAMTTHSLLRLRGWVQRSRGMSVPMIVWKTLPHFAIPALIVVAFYRLLGPLLLGAPIAFNMSYVGAYFLPDIALLLLISTIPDLAQGIYMSASAALDRARRRHSAAATATLVEIGPPEEVRSAGTAGREKAGV